MSEIIIRKYKDDDETAIKNIVKDDYPKYAEDLADFNRDEIIIAEYGGIVAGYLWGRVIHHFQWQIVARVLFIYVSPEYRRRGIGTALYNEIERQVREKNDNELYSHQYYEYEIGKAFTDKLGFYFTNGSTYMIYKGGILPEEKRDMIRKYKDDDVARVHQIVARGFHALHVKLGYPDYMCVLNDELNEDRIKEYANIAEGSYVLEDNGQIVGFGNIGGKNIGSLAVDMTMNNKGYGKALAIFMTNEILKKGNETAELWCEVGNDNARHIYENIGYRETETAYWSFKKVK